MKRPSLLRSLSSISFTVAVTSPALAGCGSASGQYLEELCVCQMCSTEQRTSFEQTDDKNVERAGNVGCGDEYDALTRCAVSHGVCIDSNYSFGDACNTEFWRLGSCLNAAKCSLYGPPLFPIYCL